MYYQCKVFTPAFQEKVEAYLIGTAMKNVKKKSPDATPDRQAMLMEFEVLNLRNDLNFYWNNPHMFDNDLHIYMRNRGLERPQFQEIIFKAKQEGWQSRARIEWKGKVQKIDDIDEIFSYKSIDMMYPVPMVLLT